MPVFDEAEDLDEEDCASVISDAYDLSDGSEESEWLPEEQEDGRGGFEQGVSEETTAQDEIAWEDGGDEERKAEEKSDAEEPTLLKLKNNATLTGDSACPVKEAALPRAHPVGDLSKSFSAYFGPPLTRDDILARDIRERADRAARAEELRELEEEQERKQKQRKREKNRVVQQKCRAGQKRRQIEAGIRDADGKMKKVSDGIPLHVRAILTVPLTLGIAKGSSPC